MVFEVIYKGVKTGQYVVAENTRLAFGELRKLAQPKTETDFLNWNIKRV